jgi:hypothetical protein
MSLIKLSITDVALIIESERICDVTQHVAELNPSTFRL